MIHSKQTAGFSAHNSVVKSWLIRITWTLGFVVLVRTAKSFDLLNKDFESAGGRLLLFNAARSILVLYMGLVLFQFGQWTQQLRCGTLRGMVPETAFARIILCTMYGAGVATLLTFALGLANLYYDNIALMMTIPVVWASSQWLPSIAQNFVPQVRQQLSSLSTYSRSLLFLLLSILSLGISLTFVLKGLWPGDAGPAGGDVYQHYLPYYREVISNHGLSPNSLWYHYYVSKGAGLFYFSMLLSDEMAPQLVTLCFQLLYVAIVYNLATSLTRSRLFGILASITLIFVYLPDHYWGQFMKHHEIMAAWILFAIWLLCYLGKQKKIHWSHYSAGAVMFSVAFSIQFPTASALMLPLFCLVALWYSYTNRRQASIIAALQALAILLGIGALLAFNQWQSGLAMDTPFRLFWRFADVSRFSEWASPYLVLYLDEGSSKGVGELISPLVRLTNLEPLFELLRFKELLFISPLIQGACIALSILLVRAWLVKQSVMKKNERTAFLIASFGLACLVSAFLRISSSATATFMILCMVASFYVACAHFYRIKLRVVRFQPSDLSVLLLGLVCLAWLMANIVNQPVSIHRMFSFLTSITIIVFLYAWVTIVHFVRRYAAPTIKLKRFITFVVIFGAALLVAVSQADKIKVAHKLAFAVGLESPLEALSKQGEVWPPYLLARKIVGLHEPILTFGIQGDVMKTSLAFPGPGLQSEVSYSLGRNWHKIGFGSPDEAEKELKELGINYFLVDLKEQSLFGAVPFSRLFKAKEFAKRFNMIADFDGVWLLAWKENGGREMRPAEIVVWDLMRAGCVDLDNNVDQLRGQLVSDFVELLAKPNSPKLRLNEEFDEREEILNKLDSAVREVLTSSSFQLDESTAEAAVSNVRLILSTELKSSLVSGKIQSDPWWVAAHLVSVALHQVSVNIQKRLSQQLVSDGEKLFNKKWAKIVNSGMGTQLYRELSSTVEATYIYNKGATDRTIIRKPGLHRAKGWQ
jgi:hypothetical protein